MISDFQEEAVSKVSCHCGRSEAKIRNPLIISI